MLPFHHQRLPLTEPTSGPRGTQARLSFRHFLTYFSVPGAVPGVGGYKMNKTHGSHPQRVSSLIRECNNENTGKGSGRFLQSWVSQLWTFGAGEFFMTGRGCVFIVRGSTMSLTSTRWIPVTLSRSPHRAPGDHSSHIVRTRPTAGTHALGCRSVKEPVLSPDTNTDFFRGLVLFCFL